MLPLALLLLVAAEPPPPRTHRGPVKLATGSFRFVGVENDLRTFIPEHVGQRLQRPGLSVITASDVQSLLGLERQRQLLGCGDAATQCMAELAGALGAEGLVLGDVARVGGALQVNLKIIAGNDGHALATFSRRLDGDRHLLEALDEGADALAGEVLRALRPPLLVDKGPVTTPSTRIVLEREGFVSVGAPPEPAPPPPLAGPSPLVPLLGGAALMAAGGALLGLASANDAALRAHHAPALPTETALQLANRGASFQAIGLGVAGAGVLALGAAAWLWRAGPAPMVQASVWAGPAGGALVLNGVLP